MQNLIRRVAIPLPLLLTLWLAPPLTAQSLEGTWLVDRERSVDFDPWRRFEVRLEIDDGNVTIDRFWRANSRYTQADSITVPLGRSVEIPVRPGKWMDQVYLAVFVPDDTTRIVEANLSDDGRTLTVVTEVPLESAQQDLIVTIKGTYFLSQDGSEMTLIEERSTRTTGPPIKYTFVRP